MSEKRCDTKVLWTWGHTVGLSPLSHLFHFIHNAQANSDKESDDYGERGDANHERLSPRALNDFIYHRGGCMCLAWRKFDKIIL